MPTIILMVGIAFLMQAWVTGIQFVLVKNFRGVRIITVAHFVLACGFILLSFRDILSDFVTVVLSNTLITLGLGLTYVALYRFIGRKVNYFLPFGMTLAVLVFVTYFRYGNENLAARIVTVCAVSVPLMAANIRVLFREETRTYRMGARLIAATFALYGSIQLMRAISALLHPPESLFTQSPSQTVYFGGLFITSYLWAVGFILMVGQRLQYELNDLATKDGLTHLYNRREMVRFLEAEFGRRNRGHGNFSVLLVDIDHFKNVNDSYGHLAGDFVLAMIAGQLNATVRAEDVVARWGGEEFLILLPGISYPDALLAGKRICTEIESRIFEGEDWTVRITISIGVASSDSHQDIDGIFKAADRALYEAKRSRNMAA